MDRARLRDHLLAAHLAGAVATSRAHNLKAIRQLLLDEGEGDTDWLGVRPAREHSFYDVLRIVAERAGINADPAQTEGTDTIDVELSLDGIEATAARLAKAARDRQRVFAGTGHPIGVSGIYGPV
ncbi:MAG: phosphatase, partial [Actinomycetota bacterium]